MRSRKRKKAAGKECSPKPAAQNIVQQIGNLLLTLAGSNLTETQRYSGWRRFERRLYAFYGKVA